MLAEYGLIPDIFESAVYSSPEVCDLRLSRLKDALLQHGLVRNFRAGEWAAYLQSNNASLNHRARELLKKLATQKRLVLAPLTGASPPTNPAEWCVEALASHRESPLTGVIASPATATPHAGEVVVSSIDRLDTAAWWTQDRQSLRPGRTTAQYLQHLHLVLKHANFLMFLDPHLDPSKPRYGEFIQLLLAAKRPAGAPRARIEIHRVCYSGTNKQTFPESFWREVFSVLDARLSAAAMTVDVFIWDEMHDRFLISDLIGIQMGNGFDVSRARTQTTWSRLGRDARTGLQREFDWPNNPVHALRGKFRLGLAR